MFQITAIYAALIALILLTLSARVILYRRSNRLSLGDEGNKSLLKRMRAQANCAEYAPIGLILLALIEAQGAPVIAVHVLGLMLFLGRLLHGYGFSASPPIMTLRVLGTVLTMTQILCSAIALLAYAVF